MKVEPDVSRIEHFNVHGLRIPARARNHDESQSLAGMRIVVTVTQLYNHCQKSSLFE